ncbi:MAG: hypothetical protein U5O69_00450 [Candidatus Competibacteraceae bacterium]|nr:hypothetical protein [Candidatus Competibacteraceae bacterium]
MMTRDERVGPVGRPPWLLPWLAALALGAALTLLAVVLYYVTGSHSQANVPLHWNGGDLQLVGGQNAATPDVGGGLRVPPFAAPGIMLWTPPRWINAGVYGELVWTVDGLDERHPLTPIWRTLKGQARQGAGMPSAVGRADLRLDPHWEGTVTTLGVFIPGPISGPVTIHRLELRPAALTAREWLEQLWAEWTAREDWSQRSINFAAGATVRPLGSLVLLAVIWIGLSGLLYATWALAGGERLWPAPFVALFLLAWLLLDVRWQWELAQRLEHTVERFAGKDETDRRLADLDGDLYRFVLAVRQRLPERPVRLLIVSNDPSSFAAGRVRYHLLPHNGYMGFTRPPHAARAGDYVLILEPLPEVRFIPEQQTLAWEGGQLRVEWLHSAPMGALYRVLGG